MKRLTLIGLCLAFAVGCGNTVIEAPVSRSGVKEAAAHIAVGSDGLTVEQRNVKARLEFDNKPGSIKHFYLFSAYSGQCLIYSSVKGKVTSSGKRLTPKSFNEEVIPGGVGNSKWTHVGPAQVVQIDGRYFTTNESLEDDGTYGNSGEYIYWFDQRGVYHQQWVTGGQIPHVSSEPMPVKSIIVNIEAAYEKSDKK